MYYSVKEVSELTGVSTRTLRYYDTISLLKPHHYTESGYRMYSSKELDRLQLILFYKSLQFSLEEIKDLLTNGNTLSHLIMQRERLISQANHIDKLIKVIDSTISYQKGEIQMTEQQKFEAFKEEKLKDNEALYGDELREKYDEDTLSKSHTHYKHLSQDSYDKAVNAERKMFQLLHVMVNRNLDVTDLVGEEVFECHKTWLEIMSGMYSNAYHFNLASLYIADERFTQYYNDRLNGSAELLSKIIMHYTK
ncbi:MerR family transcriptional regulator [Macrococcoides canis]|uniref:MerR family transcriptional regulator n=1 Tax=Macrococcoides canis TaxID=1855823 RepID=UPI00207C2F77|nr:MerR family transcriptional regulator [Macrococcus canis]MCO4096826.1 MerR family transcriptional regulator [Macrococcus canis]UTH09591.1 MerR family transcriptional regulator [Macrococcus canis]